MVGTVEAVVVAPGVRSTVKFIIDTRQLGPHECTVVVTGSGWDQVGVGEVVVGVVPSEIVFLDFVVVGWPFNLAEKNFGIASGVPLTLKGKIRRTYHHMEPPCAPEWGAALGEARPT